MKKLEQAHKPLTVRITDGEALLIKKAALDTNMTAGKLFVSLLRDYQAKNLLAWTEPVVFHDMQQALRDVDALVHKLTMRNTMMHTDAMAKHREANAAEMALLARKLAALLELLSQPTTEEIA